MALSRQGEDVAVIATPGNNLGPKPVAMVNPSPSIGWISPQASTGTAFTLGFVPAVGAPTGDTIVLAQIAVMGITYDPPSGYGDDKLRYGLRSRPTLNVARGSTNKNVSLKKHTFQFFRQGENTPRVFPCSVWLGNVALTWPGVTQSGSFTLSLTLSFSNAPGNRAVVYVGRVMHGRRIQVTGRSYQDRQRTRIINPGAPRTRGRYPNTRRQQGSVEKNLVFRSVLEPQFDQLYDLQQLAGDHNPIAFFSNETYHEELLYARISEFSWEDQVAYKNVSMRLEEVTQAEVQAEPISGE